MPGAAWPLPQAKPPSHACQSALMQIHGIENYLVGAMDKETGQVSSFCPSPLFVLLAAPCRRHAGNPQITPAPRTLAARLAGLLPCTPPPASARPARPPHHARPTPLHSRACSCWPAAVSTCLQCTTFRRGRQTRGWALQTLAGAAPPSTRWGARRCSGLHDCWEGGACHARRLGSNKLQPARPASCAAPGSHGQFLT